MSPAPSSIDFILEFGTALHRYGTPAHRLEGALAAMAECLDLDAQILSTPTSIMVGFGAPSEARTALRRVNPGAHNLEKLAAVDALAERIARKELSLDRAINELREIDRAPNTLGPVWTTLAFPAVSAASASLLGGGPADMAVAGGSGLAIGLLGNLMPRTTAGGHLFELVAATLAGAAAHAATVLGLGAAYQTSMLAGLIALVPGLTLTVAMAEIATRNLVSGTARLTASAVVFLQIIFGVALSEKVLTHFIGAPAMTSSVAMSAWVELAVLPIACLAVAALFRAHPRDFPIIAFTAIAAFYSARLGATHLSAELGACLGGFVAAGISNAYARIGNRSAMVPLVPGLLLLVPGSLGFRSLSSLWEQDVVGGIDAAFKMVLVAISLVVGLLVANAVVLPRRSL